jgi:hypothetical protein
MAGTLWVYDLEPGKRTKPMRPNRQPPAGPLVALWIPRTFVEAGGVDVGAFRADVNEKIERRGMVLYDGQILTTPMPDDAELIVDDGQYDAVPAREWSQPHRNYFGLHNPYQMAEDGDVFTYSHVMWRVRETYLQQDEQISAVVDGETDARHFSCPCHFAHVVYTTRHRLICMSCGALHAVLLSPIAFRHRTALSAEEWSDYFEDGDRRDEAVDLAILDFRDLEHAPKLWVTSQWLDAVHEFIFFARSPEDVIWEAIRGTERDPTIFAEAGWTPMPLPPAPADQLRDDSVDVDLLENAALALAEGAGHFAKGRTQPEHLVHAIPQLFRALELILKAKLLYYSPQALDDHPRIAIVIKRLAANGLQLSKTDQSTIDVARKLRNKLQHGTATFNHRAALSACRKLIIFLDRFTIAELEIWVGHVVPREPWCELLRIPEIAQTATAAVEGIIEDVRKNPDATISRCNHCGNEALIREHPRTGASCIYCQYIPDDQVAEVPDS